MGEVLEKKCGAPGSYGSNQQKTKKDNPLYETNTAMEYTR